MEPELLDVDEAAHFLAIGRTALYALLRQGEIPVIKIGRSTRISVAALREFIERKEAELTGAGWAADARDVPSVRPM